MALSIFKDSSMEILGVQLFNWNLIFLFYLQIIKMAFDLKFSNNCI